MRARATTLAMALVLLGAMGEAGATDWSAGGRVFAAWSGGWPTLDLRGRLGLVVAHWHELEVEAGLSTERLASRVSYTAGYSRTWVAGRVWPVVSVWLGGASDLLGVAGQTRLVVGTGFGLRLPVGRSVAIRIALGHEVLAAEVPVKRIAVSLGLELLGGRWPDPAEAAPSR